MMFLKKAKEFLEQNKLKDKYDFLIVDFHGEITKMKRWLSDMFLMVMLH